MWNKLKPYVGFVALSLGVGALAAFLTRDNMNIYDSIIAPPLSPPMWLFPVVWTVLYILMGIGAAIVYTESGEQSGIFYSQLAVNFLWSIIFFNLRMFLLSSIWLVLLIVLIWKMIGEWRTYDIRAAYLQYPYLAWCIFALYLNVAIWWLNR
ncbi:MAG: tryptophan-rich sensory protein [Clostridia bacterium]|nr:tryptophan-rich sensory protein [Clostridia bacterium]